MVVKTRGDCIGTFFFFNWAGLLVRKAKRFIYRENLVKTDRISERAMLNTSLPGEQ